MKYERIGQPQMVKVTKYDPCPICGKPDWCFSSTSTYSFEEGINEDFVFVGCRRITSDSVAGSDGNYYVFSKESMKDNVAIYEEVMQRAHRFNRMGIDKTIKVSKNYIVKTSKKRVCLTEYKLATVEKRDAVYRAFLELLYLEDYHRRSLYDELWVHDLIESSMFKSLPPSGYHLSQLIKKKKSGEELTDYETVSLNLKNLSRKKIAEKLYLLFGDLEGIPGFYLKHSNYNNNEESFWTFTGAQGIAMPMFDVDGKIFALRVRVDLAEKNKYKWFQSVYEKLDSESDTEVFYKNTYEKGSNLPPKLSYRFPKYQTQFLFATEGEKKQHVVVEKEGLACVNIPGVSCFSSILEDTKSLKEMGIKFIVIGYDADKGQNTHVLKAELKLIKTLLEEGFGIYVAGWDVKLGKGVDDVILSDNKIAYEPLLEYLKNFDE